MTTDRKYNKLVSALRNAQPELGRKDELVEEIMGNAVSLSSRRPGVSSILFGWIDVVWLRWTLSTASVLVLVLFIFQQFIMIDRIGKLESRMTGVNRDMMLDYQKENIRVNSVMMEISDYRSEEDSIKVASKDLNSLLRSYRELQERYSAIQDKLRQGEDPLDIELNEKLKL